MRRYPRGARAALVAAACLWLSCDVCRGGAAQAPSVAPSAAPSSTPSPRRPELTVWTTAEGRVVGCDEGPPDGDAGETSTASVTVSVEARSRGPTDYASAVTLQRASDGAAPRWRALLRDPRADVFQCVVQRDWRSMRSLPRCVGAACSVEMWTECTPRGEKVSCRPRWADLAGTLTAYTLEVRDCHLPRLWPPRDPRRAPRVVVDSGHTLTWTFENPLLWGPGVEVACRVETTEMIYEHSVSVGVEVTSEVTTRVAQHATALRVLVSGTHPDMRFCLRDAVHQLLDDGSVVRQDAYGRTSLDWVRRHGAARARRSFVVTPNAPPAPRRSPYPWSFWVYAPHRRTFRWSRLCAPSLGSRDCREPEAAPPPDAVCVLRAGSFASAEDERARVNASCRPSASGHAPPVPVLPLEPWERDVEDATVLWCVILFSLAWTYVLLILWQRHRSGYAPTPCCGGGAAPPPRSPCLQRRGHGAHVRVVYVTHRER